MTILSEEGPREAGFGPGEERKPKEVIYRHTVVVRLTHWINALALVILLGTGLNIFNAHPALYWGQKGSNLDQPWLAMFAAPSPHGYRGVTAIGPFHVDTTGLLGLSKAGGVVHARAWPEWVTIPSFTDLADARHWHFFFAWILSVNALAYLLWSLGAGHLKRDILPTLADLRAIPQSVGDHIRLKHPTGDAAKRYNVLQRLAYLTVILLVTGMILTGLSMSPGIGAAAPWLVQAFGGRQSARSLHFLFAFSLVAFVVVHLVEVVLAGPINEVRSMITGRYAVPVEHD